MSASVAVWAGYLESRMVFEPKPLIDRVVSLIFWVASIKINQESPVLQCNRVDLNRTLKVNADEPPFCCGQARNAVRYKKQFIHTG